MEPKNHDFLLNAKTLRLVIYSSLVIANLLFILLYPVHALIGVIGALFFFVLLLWFLWKDAAKTSTKIFNASQPRKSTH